MIKMCAFVKSLEEREAQVERERERERERSVVEREREREKFRGGKVLVGVFGLSLER